MKKDDLVILNRHKKRMPATLRMPEGEVQGVALAVHGLGGWKEQSVVVAAADALCAAGYVTLTFDAADGAIAPDATAITSTVTGFLEDLEDVIAYAKKQEWYQGPLVLEGHSLGALITTEYAATHPEVTKLILVAPAISWRMYSLFVIPMGIWWFITGRRESPAPKGVNYVIGRRWLVDFLTYDSHKTAANVTIPTLVVSAGKDGLVGTPKMHARYTKLFAHGEQRVIAGAGHTLFKHEKEVADTIAAWLT
ncbi:lysophospholipase [Patescibacteria group bacterium]|nr:lysophospholipase [Patescibacteria group bacterium]MBU1754851.1 lysophospholipase [Patescibacteria group bacterium]